LCAIYKREKLEPYPSTEQKDNRNLQAEFFSDLPTPRTVMAKKGIFCAARRENAARKQMPKARI